MEDHVIFRSLTRAPRWMGMERIPGALWVLGSGMLILTGLMYAGAFGLTALVAALCAAGITGLRRLGDHDPVFFRVAFRRLRYRDIYPARVLCRDLARMPPRRPGPVQTGDPSRMPYLPPQTPTVPPRPPQRRPALSLIPALRGWRPAGRHRLQGGSDAGLS